MADGMIAKVLEGFRFNNRPREGANRSPLNTIGAQGTAVYGGYPETNETHNQLVGREKYRTYSLALVNASIVAAGIRYYVNLVAKAGWKVVPADDSDEAQRIAEAVEKALFNMETPWPRVVRRAAMYRPYGFSIQEWTARRAEDGSIDFKDVAPRPQVTIERWDINRDGTVAGVTQRIPQTSEEIYLPRERIVYAVDDSLSDSPEGLGLFRSIIDSVRRLKFYEELEGRGFESDLRGVPVGKAPIAELQRAVDAGEMTKEQMAKQLEGIEKFLKNHIKTSNLSILVDSMTYTSEDDAATPSTVPQWAIELLQAGNTSQEAIARTIERLNREIARVLGVEGLLLGSDGGSQALSRDKSNNFFLIVDGTLTELASSFERDLIRPLGMLNGWDENLLPGLVAEATQFKDVTQITEALRDLAVAGSVLLPDDPAISQVRSLIGLDSPDPNSVAAAVALMGNRATGGITENGGGLSNRGGIADGDNLTSTN